MDRPPLIVLEVVLAFAVPLGWGVWELVSLRRDRKRQERAAAESESRRPRIETDVAGDDRPT